MINKNKICTYCGESGADEEDHVIARQLFPPEQKFRANLPKVPSCGKCNREKQQVEDIVGVLFQFSLRFVFFTLRHYENMKFPDNLVKGLKPKNNPYRLFEKGSDKGFGIQVTPSGTKSFFCNIHSIVKESS